MAVQLRHEVFYRMGSHVIWLSSFVMKSFIVCNCSCHRSRLRRRNWQSLTTIESFDLCFISVEVIGNPSCRLMGSHIVWLSSFILKSFVCGYIAIVWAVISYGCPAPSWSLSYPAATIAHHEIPSSRRIRVLASPAGVIPVCYA